MLNKEITTFAYPNGMHRLDYGEREIRNLKNAGYRLAFTTRAGYFKRSDSVFEIPRLEINSGQGLKLKLKVTLAPLIQEKVLRKLRNGSWYHRRRVKTIMASQTRSVYA